MKMFNNKNIKRMVSIIIFTTMVISLFVAYVPVGATVNTVINSAVTAAGPIILLP